MIYTDHAALKTLMKHNNLGVSETCMVWIFMYRMYGFVINIKSILVWIKIHTGIDYLYLVITINIKIKKNNQI